MLEEWLYVYPNGKKQTWFHRKQGSPIVFSKKMPGENRTIEALTRKNSLFLSAAAQNNHEALLPVYGWLAGMSFVLVSRPFIIGYTTMLCAQSDVKNQIARMVSVADLGIDEMVVQQTKMTDQMRTLFDAIKTVAKIQQEGPAPETRAEIRLVHRFGNKTVSFENSQESAGTIAYLSLLGFVVDALKKGVPLLIDELDESLHPLLAIELVRLFNNPLSNPNGAQLIFNTQDTNLLSAGVLRRDQIWFTEKGTGGSSHLFPLSDFKPRRQENLQNGYLQGRYGAIPFINPDSFLTRFEGGNV